MWMLMMQVEKGQIGRLSLADNTLPQSVILAKADLVNAADRELEDLAGIRRLIAQCRLHKLTGCGNSKLKTAERRP